MLLFHPGVDSFLKYVRLFVCQSKKRQMTYDSWYLTDFETYPLGPSKVDNGDLKNSIKPT